MRNMALPAAAIAVVVVAFAVTPAPLYSLTQADAGQTAPDRGSGRQALTDSLSFGSRVIPANTEVQGPIVVAGGNLTVLGTIIGSAVAIAGDVRVGAGGRVTGDAIAAFGSVDNQGRIEGNQRNYTGAFGESVRALLGNGPESIPGPPRSLTVLALGWFMVILLVGLGVLVFASPYLSGVVDVLEQSFWRSFLVGIAGELGIVPAALILVIGLAITVLGALLIPFALVALVLAVAGLATLGFVAVARLTGDGISGGRSTSVSDRGSALRGLVVGLVVYMGIWVLAGLLSDVPVAGVALSLLAQAVTYVAITAGFGAALLSRGGTRRDAVAAHAPAPAIEAAWQTPTPITGVVAARRPRSESDRTVGSAR